MERGARAIAAAAAMFLATGGAALRALEWPLSPAGIAATFGTQAKGRIVSGIALAASGGQVRAAGEGELVFAAGEGIGPSGLPSALGAFVVVEHDRRMAAVYSHLASGTVDGSARALGKGEALGASGVSGWAEGEGMLFQVYDREESRWVNPLLLLPPVADEKPPAIRSIVLSRGGDSFVLGDAKSLRQGNYSISLIVSDPSDAAWTAGPLAPYALRLSIDGTQAAKGVFDVARAVGGDLCFFSDPPRPASTLRGAEGGYVLAERLLTRGRVVFEAVAEDAAGNRRTASWTVTVE